MTNVTIFIKAESTPPFKVGPYDLLKKEAENLAADFLKYLADPDSASKGGKYDYMVKSETGADEVRTLLVQFQHIVLIF